MTGPGFMAAVAACSAAVAVVAAHAAIRLALRLRARRVDARIEIDLRRLIRWASLVRRRAERHADRVLPDLLERVARALRGGASLPVALADAQPAAPAALAAEWRSLVAEAADVGVVEAAARWRARRPSSRSITLTAAALAVASDVGGPQARALDSVAATLRQRLALQAEVRALGAQARASAAVVALAPAAFAVIASGLEPAYLSFLLGTSSGLVMLVCGLGLEAAGLAWMAKISRVAA